jgi:uncharacterized protein (UPF0303 family)
VNDSVPDFERFTHDEAWVLGLALVQRCRDDNLAVVVSIHLGDQRVFHAALPGTSADNDAWADRKARIVRRFDLPSATVASRHGSGADFLEVFGLPSADYWPGAGAVPIRVRGTQVGVVSISGLAGDADHDLAMAALRRAATL